MINDESSTLHHLPGELAPILRILCMKRNPRTYERHLPVLDDGVLLADGFVQHQPVTHALVPSNQERGAAMQVLGVYTQK